nr:MAG TPA: hypothetical protein [Caudoviricetes sp.]
MSFIVSLFLFSFIKLNSIFAIRNYWKSCYTREVNC